MSATTLGTFELAGQTWADWSMDLFEYEYCDECHGDAPHHEPWGFTGHWFAHCRFSKVIRNQAGRQFCVRRKGEHS